jgi:pyrroline-5-carboxylate reductase
VLLCLMADVAPDVLATLPWRADHSVISVMVDVPLVDLTRLCAPAHDIALTVPLSAVALGGSVLPCHPESRALTVLFGECDTIINVPSKAGLNAHFAASASSEPLLTLMQTGSKWLADHTGDLQGAETYVAGVFKGLLRQMPQQGADFDPL